MFWPVLAEAFRAPFRDPHWRARLGVGGLLNAGLMVSLLSPVTPIVGLGVLVLLMGYFYRAFVDGLNGLPGDRLPDWRHWRAYLFAGLSLLLISAGYILAAAVGLTAVMSGLGVTPSAESPEQLSQLLMLMMVTSLLLYSFLPIAFARYAAESRVWAAFDPAALWHDVRRVVTGTYVQACLGFYGLSLAGNLLLGAVPGLGLALVGVYLFLLMLVFASIFGRLIGAAEKPEEEDAAP